MPENPGLPFPGRGVGFLAGIPLGRPANVAQFSGLFTRNSIQTNLLGPWVARRGLDNSRGGSLRTKIMRAEGHFYF